MVRNRLNNTLSSSTDIKKDDKNEDKIDRKERKLYFYLTFTVISLIILGFFAFKFNILPRILEGELLWSETHLNEDPIPAKNGVRALNEVKTVAKQLHGTIGLNKDGDPIYKLTTVTNDRLNQMVKENYVQQLNEGGGFNTELSDSITLDRDSPDFRADECKTIKYDYSMLPKASIVMIFHNESKSMLLRSVHSVFNHTPPSILHEIILVDDGSTSDWITDKNSELEKYVLNTPKLRLVRLKQRLGIVGARMAGIKEVQSPVFVILDSHIEVGHMWLEPLLKRIAEKPSALVMPVIDGIDSKTLEVRAGGINCVLGFIWVMIEHAINPKDFNSSLPDRLSLDPSVYVSSPTMAGGLFAANKDYFLNHLEGYDTNFIFWGAENLELSFRTWMCGGSIECTSCSRVAHMFRTGGSAYQQPANSVTKNRLRLIEGWMDEFKHLAWKTSGAAVLDYGDLSNVKEFRDRKQCKSFSWYLENIYPESFVKKIEDVPYLGHLHNIESKNYVTVPKYWAPTEASFKLSPHNGNDLMYFKTIGYIMPVYNDETCLSTDSESLSDWCRIYNQNQRFSVTESEEGLTITDHKGRCLTESGLDLKFSKCNRSHSQLWSWQKYEPPFNFTIPKK